MNKRIIYKSRNGRVSVIIPVECGLTVQEIAEKDVPTGLAYKIVDIADIPTDLTERDLWDVDKSDLTDGVGA